MQFNLEIDLEAASFEGEKGPAELARILRGLANELNLMETLQPLERKILDIDTNYVGDANIA